MALAKLTDKKYVLTQVFGKPLVVNGINFYAPMKGHNWLDYGIPSGTPLLATIDGKVEVTNQFKRWYGLHVKIYKTRADGISEVIYWHLTSTNLKTGDIVKVWDVIGKSGGGKSSPTSGLSTGPHLHFGLRWRTLSNDVINYNNGYYGWIDPTPFFA